MILDFAIILKIYRLLQKYRIFLKRISEISNSSENSGNTNLNERPLRSRFVLNELSYLTNNLQQQYKEILSRKTKGTAVYRSVYFQIY